MKTVSKNSSESSKKSLKILNTLIEASGCLDQFCVTIDGLLPDNGNSMKPKNYEMLKTRTGVE